MREPLPKVRACAGGMRAAGPAAKPPTRAQPVCFDAVETACGPMPAPCRGPGLSNPCTDEDEKNRCR